jgi:predicted DNA-binding ribbon-helix-helix protein
LAQESLPKGRLSGEVKKRSVLIRGHSTSISLEQAFWVQIKSIATRRNQSLNALVATIDEDRDTNLSSALRLLVLEDLLSEIETKDL